MSIITSCDYGSIVDHKKHINESLLDSTSSMVYVSQKSLFDVHVPFLMDSQYEKLQRDDDSGNKRDRKHRKRKCPHNEETYEMLQLHTEFADIINKGYASLLELAKTLNYFLLKPPADCGNNIECRKASQIEGAGWSLVEKSTQLREDMDDRKPLILEKSGRVNSSLFNRLVHHVSLEPSLISCKEGDFILPASCTYMMSDISHMEMLLKCSDRFDLIVIDPPWKNKSVKRLKKYGYLDSSEVLDIPIQKLASNGALIAIWVTNKAENHNFIKETLFPRWNVEIVAHWVWLKVTTSGITTKNISSAHSKPYETLIIGKLIDSSVKSNEDFTCGEKIPSEYVIMSIPCSIHSRKPPLDMLKQYLKPNANCLELFARNLLPGWTSWGNEVLKYQHLDFFSAIKN